MSPFVEAYPKTTREMRLLRVNWTPEGLDWNVPHSADVLSDPWNFGCALVPERSSAFA